ncbi:hypothetical protein GTP41_24145 [Pseudoduganella sp. DS3]|uniref:Uncharacterized protein n=1 Tax=Pseudoduganella guangdongensis TaxID=2692179 RepID=A0A6N9HN88_9BURK|nr:hypothetical protein [Pseudoduganella guangdongensis]MYN05191.1 hypothetical protein [Pseudoduganella guangdongensis]
MAHSLDSQQAYKAMFKFLEKYYELTNSGEVGALLGSMALIEDGKPLDPALWDDWMAAVEATLAAPL